MTLTGYPPTSQPGPPGATSSGILDIEHVVGSAGEPAFQNGWANVSVPTYGGLRFRKDPFGRVSIYGAINTGTNGSTIFTLPVGYRPPTTMLFPVVGDGAAAGNWWQIDAAGNVVGTRASGTLYGGTVVFDTDSVGAYLTGPAGPAGPAASAVPVDFKARCSVAQGAAGAGVAVGLLFNSDAVAYNNGGFTYHSAGSGTLQDGVIVPSTGEYRITLACGTVANSQYLGLQLYVNGSTVLPDTSQKAVVYGGPASLGNPFIELTATVHLTAGDTISAKWWQGPGPQNLLADFTTWAIEKVQPAGPTGPAGPGALTPTAKSAAYGAQNGELVQMTGAFTVALPMPLAGSRVGVISVNGTGAAPCLVSTPSGVIKGKGVAAGATSIKLGTAGANVTLVADGTNWNITEGEQDTGWIASGALSNGATGGFNYRLIGNRVVMYGNWSSGGMVNGGVFYTLPVGFRPIAQFDGMQFGSYNSAPIPAFGIILATGAMYLYYGAAAAPTQVGMANVHFLID